MGAIDADAVPQEFWEYEFDGKWRGCTIKDLLDSQPTIQPAEPKRIKGKWITDKEGYVTWSAICNKCGARTQMFDGYYNFCPHCGVKMEK